MMKFYCLLQLSILLNFDFLKLKISWALLQIEHFQAHAQPKRDTTLEFKN